MSTERTSTDLVMAARAHPGSGPSDALDQAVRVPGADKLRLSSPAVMSSPVQSSVSSLKRLYVLLLLLPFSFSNYLSLGFFSSLD